MNAPPALGRPLTGDAGYARLIRLLARAFYAGECPPKDVEPDDIPAGARTIRRDKVREAAQCRRRCRHRRRRLRCLLCCAALPPHVLPAFPAPARHRTSTKGWECCCWTCWRLRTAM